MDAALLTKIAGELPAELVRALRTEGLDKLASTVYGLPTHDEHTVYRAIGTSLFLRRKEAATISRGLRAMQAIQER